MGGRAKDGARSDPDHPWRGYTETLGAKLTARMKETHGLKPSHVAKACGQDPGTVGRCLDGLSPKMAVGTLMAVAAALGLDSIPVSWWFGNEVRTLATPEGGDEEDPSPPDDEPETPDDLPPVSQRHTPRQPER